MNVKGFILAGAILICLLFLPGECDAQGAKTSVDTFPEPVNLGPMINSQWNDYAPCINPLGDRLHFTSRRKSIYSILGDSSYGWGEDLYEAYKIKGEWQQSELLPPPINSSRHDGVATFSGDGQLMIYSICDSAMYNQVCDFYTSRFIEGAWTRPQIAEVLNDLNAWDAHPALSADGKTLIFSSSRAGGYGVTDLYISRKDLYDQWGEPENLGPLINSEFSEYSPFLSQDGRTLYFSSDRPGGLGQLDVYKVRLDDTGWADLQNMGAGVNSAGMDYFFSIGGDGSQGYMTSSREGSIGGMDIYSIEVPEALRPKPTTVITGVVRDGKTSAFANAVITLREGDHFLSYYTTDSRDGSYLIVLEPGKSYTLSYRMKKGAYYQEVFDLESGLSFEKIEKDVVLMPLLVEKEYTPADIYFDTGKYIISERGQIQLDKLYILFRDNPSMKLEILGHTDSVGSRSSNLILSEKRAEAAKKYLESRGVAASRMTTRALGETIPAFSNNLASGRANNRRVEFVILK